jgi:flagellar protein FlaG
MDIKPARPVNSVTAIATVASERNNVEKNADLAHLTLRRRQGAPAHEDTPQDALKKAERDKEALNTAAENLNKLMGFIDKDIQFAVHEDTQRMMVKVVRADSGDVLSEFPSEKMLDLLASLVQTIGVAVDEKI